MRGKVLPARTKTWMKRWSFSAFLVAVLLSSGAVSLVRAAEPLHWTGDRTLWDRRGNKVELIGNAAVHQASRSILADRILLDIREQSLDAQGNCIYLSGDTVVRADRISINLETDTGTIEGGRISNPGFTLTGRRLYRLSELRYRAEEGTYTTCVDCPESWTLLGDDFDIEIDGYAFMRNVSASIKDVPFFWFPYVVIPLKTRRQSGFLFPRIAVVNEGVRIVQPFYWALSRSADMTFGLGYFGGRGLRGELEARYRLGERSFGKADVFILQDDSFATYLEERGYEGSSSRWALSVEQAQSLPWGFEQKLRIVEASDELYPRRIGDLGAGSEMFLTSELFLTHTSEETSSYLSFKRHRNLLNLGADPRDFDERTVQPFPSLLFAANDRPLFGTSVHFGFSLGATRFERDAGDYDVNPLVPAADDAAAYRPGVDPLRKASRILLNPSLYTTLRPGGYFSLIPSVEYRNFFYRFPGEVEDLSRSYFHFKATASAQWERIFETSDPQVPRIKHLIRPTITWSRIPWVFQDKEHPFTRQLALADSSGYTGLQFDDLDIIPLGRSLNLSNYFVPQGHSLGLGVVSQLVRRKGALDAPDPTYQRMLEVSAGQSIDLLELERKTDQQPFSRLTLGSLLNLDRFEGSLDYAYYPYAEISENRSRHQLSTRFAWQLEKAFHQGVLAYERSLSAGYAFKALGDGQTHDLRLGVTWSLSDYVVPMGSLNLDLRDNLLKSLSGTLRFQSPSKCYRVEVTGTQKLCPEQPKGGNLYCFEADLNLALNFTGEGFGSFDSLAAGKL